MEQREEGKLWSLEGGSRVDIQGKLCVVRVVLRTLIITGQRTYGYDYDYGDYHQDSHSRVSVHGDYQPGYHDYCHGYRSEECRRNSQEDCYPDSSSRFHQPDIITSEQEATIEKFLCEIYDWLRPEIITASVRQPYNRRPCDKAVLLEHCMRDLENCNTWRLPS